MLGKTLSIIYPSCVISLDIDIAYNVDVSEISEIGTKVKASVEYYNIGFARGKTREIE
jgi:hypothetical protein